VLSDAEALALLRATQARVLADTAAGNEGPELRTVENPYPWSARRLLSGCRCPTLDLRSLGVTSCNTCYCTAMHAYMTRYAHSYIGKRATCDVVRFLAPTNTVLRANPQATYVELHMRVFVAQGGHSGRHHTDTLRTVLQ
jgi:hypothetical protein